MFLKKNIFIRIILMDFSFFSCTKISDEDKVLRNFTAKFVKEIESDYGFGLYAFGGSVPVKIEEIILKFKTDHTSNVDNARKLVIPLALKFIERMNQDKNLRPYLGNYPALLKNISLTIRFNCPQKQNEINTMMIIGAKDLVVYNVYNDKKTMLVDFHRETFEEAERILQEEGLLNF